MAAVAALAGVPKEVIKRASETARAGKPVTECGGRRLTVHGISLLAPAEETSPAVEALENLDPDSLTPASGAGVGFIG